jgi:hypothetical protein
LILIIVIFTVIVIELPKEIKMRKICVFFILLIIVLYINSCKGPICHDQVSVFKGKVTDKLTGNAVDSVMVGMIKPSTPDSVVFLSDSVNRAFIRFVTKTDSTGRYYKDFFLGYNIDTSFYKDFFAYKEGYKLWRYLEHDSKVIRTHLIDELNIVLEKN